MDAWNKPRAMGPPDIRLVIPVLIAFAFVLARTAWISDDAYITFRTVDNFIHGYGLRWNIAERVQTYTHPLWMFLLASLYFLTKEIFLTSLVFSMAVSLGALLVLTSKIASSTAAAAWGVVALLASRAFVDYSTSGLENPLSHLLGAVFLAVYFRSPLSLRTLLILSGIAFLAAFNRADTLLLYLPALAVFVFRLRTFRAVPVLLLGTLPFLLWEVFSIVYYGFPFPNTAYAKLNTGISSPALIRQGLIYLRQSLYADPVTLALTAVGAAVLLFGKDERPKFAAWGALLYLLYVVRIGGDFMSGRFLTVPLFFLVAALAAFTPRSPFFSRNPAAWSAVGAALLLCVALPSSPLLSGPNYGSGTKDKIDANGICDERGFYFQNARLLRWRSHHPMPDHPMVQQGRDAAAQNMRVVVRSATGYFGFFAGPSVHIVDIWALGDALLARLPITGTRFHEGRLTAPPSWRIGHFERAIPQGYLPTIESGRNQIADRNLAAFYDKLALIVRGPLLDGRRFIEILKMNLGLNQRLVDHFLETSAS